MQCHVIILDTTGTTYTFYNERKLTKANRKIKKTIIQPRYTEKKQTAGPPPPQVMWQTPEKNELEKNKIKNKKHHYL